jgi:hypothetical protein
VSDFENLLSHPEMDPLYVAAGGLFVLSLLAKPFVSKLRLNKTQTFVLKSNLVEVHISALGGIIQRLLVADNQGVVDDIVLGHDKLSDYLVGHDATCACKNLVQDKHNMFKECALDQERFEICANLVLK